MEDNRLQAKGFLVWGICALFFLYEFFLRTVIGTYQQPLMKDLELNSFQFSLLSTTLFLLIYGLMQIPVGLIVDQLGLKKSLLIGTICCTVASIGFGYSYSYSMAIFFRILMGCGAAFGFICLLMSVHEWMPHKYSGVFIGLSQFIGTLGPMFSAGPLETLTENFEISWRSLFLTLSVTGIGLSILVILFVKNNRQKRGKYTILYKPEKVTVSIRRLFQRSQPWMIALISTFLYFSIEYLSENEGRAFLVQKGTSGNFAGYILTVSWLGYAIGCPVLGFLSDLLERRRSIILLSSCIGFISICCILYIPGKQHLLVAFLLLGFSAGGQSIGFAIMAEQFRKQFIAIGFGLNNAAITTISAISAPILGLCLDLTQEGTVASLSDYQMVFSSLVIIALIGLMIAFFFIKETFCKSVMDFVILNVKRREH